MREKGISVEIIDGTFKKKKEVIEETQKFNPSIIGVYAMFTMEHNSLNIAKSLRKNGKLLIVGGPLPSVYPENFLGEFDIVVRGEGEQTMLEIVQFNRGEKELSQIPGIVYNGLNRKIVYNPPRKLISNLDSIPLPSRDLFDNKAYMNYYQQTHGHLITSIISSRGCPYHCDFCSKPVFGDSYRERSAKNVLDEIEDVLSYGYEYVFFQDDCFTLNQKRVEEICNAILDRKIKIGWYCLSRVDAINQEMLSMMRQAGCKQIFFGIESGNNSVLKMMKKEFTIEQTRKAVELTAASEIKTGAFFILGYPGETDETILNTIQFATSLPLDYLSFTLPYPIPGTGLYKRIKDQQINLNSIDSGHRFIDHQLTFKSPFSERKLKFAILKGMIQFKAKKHWGSHLYSIFGKSFDVLTDNIFKALK
jgi:anaerobic magnesium-protoporphyrin IX monomethyl ester cyclase